MILLSHPTGNVFVRALLQTLGDSMREFEFHTTVGFAQAGLARLPSRWRQAAARRAYDLAPTRLHRHPWREFGRLCAARLPAAGLARHESGPLSIDAVYRSLDRAVAARVRRGGTELVYAYEDGAAETFAAAEDEGIRCCYELPIAWWEMSRPLLQEEAQRLPEWAPTLVGPDDSAEKLDRKTRELELADMVICPSRFVHDSLPPRIRERTQCVISEFGSPSVSGDCTASRAGDEGRRLRVLFAGAMTQRKGLADVFAAMKLLGRADVDLIVMGAPLAPMAFYRQQFPHFTYEAPRPREEVLALMRRCDVLVLPSIVEGRALVQQEALSCGLPIIVTANAGGADLVDEGRTGFLVPIRSPEKIASALDTLAERRADLPEMRRAAQAKAAEYRWSDYGTRILEAIDLMTNVKTAKPV